MCPHQGLDWTCQLGMCPWPESELRPSVYGLLTTEQNWLGLNITSSWSLSWHWQSDSYAALGFLTCQRYFYYNIYCFAFYLSVRSDYKLFEGRTLIPDSYLNYPNTMTFNECCRNELIPAPHTIVLCDQTKWYFYCKCFYKNMIYAFKKIQSSAKTKQR